MLYLLRSMISFALIMLALLIAGYWTLKAVSSKTITSASDNDTLSTRQEWLMFWVVIGFIEHTPILPSLIPFFLEIRVAVVYLMLYTAQKGPVEEKSPTQHRALSAGRGHRVLSGSPRWLFDKVIRRVFGVYSRYVERNVFIMLSYTAHYIAMAGAFVAAKGFEIAQVLIDQAGDDTRKEELLEICDQHLDHIRELHATLSGTGDKAAVRGEALKMLAGDTSKED